MKIKVLSLPSRHPYTAKFNSPNIYIVNPESNYFTEPEKCTENYLGKNYPPSSYNIVHIHFSFDRLPIDKFESLLKYFKKVNKPIVWTLHSRESQRIKNLEDGKYQKLIFEYSDKIISPTQGCAEWAVSKFGSHKNEVEIIPLGYMASPKEVEKIAKKVKKDRNTFVMLIGDFRENKEYLQSIINFLQCSALEKVKLQVIFKPINLYKEGDRKIRSNMIYFYSIIQDPRIKKISLPNIPNNIIVEAFVKSHAAILPYKWGTHSGQLELAKDCGCRAITSDVGFYKEQWKGVCLWNASDGKNEQYPLRYTDVLIDVYQKDSLKPAGIERAVEHKKILNKHFQLYKNLLSKL